MRYLTLTDLIPAWVLALAGLAAGCTTTAQDADYDPLRTDGRDTVSRELAVRDQPRDRTIPLRVYLPAADARAPVVLFSHGLGGSRRGCAYLGRHWAARGFVAVFLQHPGSDADVWKDRARGQRMQALKQAANARNFRLRVQDVPAVLDQLERWHNEREHILHQRLDLGRVGMAGHSFGALTTQAVSGQHFGRRGALFVDERIKAAVMLSPSSPRRGTPKKAFGQVKIPWMLMTGTHDTAAIGHADVQARLDVFPALPPGGKYELLLHKAEHSAFTERSLPGDDQPRNPNHHRAVLALTTAFWDAWLRHSDAARTWLHNHGPQQVLEANDRWQTK